MESVRDGFATGKCWSIAIVQMGSDLKPSFVKAYAEVGSQIVDALRRYVEDVREKHSPEDEHAFHSPEVQALYGGKGAENE